jgi:hypothetical protein
VNRFWSGFIVFILYAMGCLLLLGFVFLQVDQEQIHTTASSTIEKTDIVEVETEPIESLKDSISTDSTVTSTKNSEVKTTPILPSEPLIFNVYEGNSTSTMINCRAFSRVYFNSSRVKIPNACINYGIEIKEILNSNPDAILTITGYSGSDELPSIGQNRAEYIQKLLKGAGVPMERMRVNSTFKNLEFTNKIATGGVRMSIHTNSTSSDTKNK